MPPDELEDLLGQLEVRAFPRGSILIAEGERLGEMYVVAVGAADVFVADRHGVERLVGRAGPGATLGEMSLLSGRPAAASVRAAQPLEARVVTETDFAKLGERFPLVYRNVGAILSRRLALTNRLVAGAAPARVTFLRDAGSPPLLAEALASSVAWHTRASTLLVDELPPSLDELSLKHDHILVRLASARVPLIPGAKTIQLAGEATAVDGAADYTVRAWLQASVHVGPTREGVVGVPPLEPADRDAIAGGQLPPDTPAGRALGWVARDIAGMKVGVALGAGSIRGFAHFGVLRELERAGVFPDCLAGTSVGAAAAALYALGSTPDEAAGRFLACGPALFRPTLSTKSFLSNRGLRAFISDLGADVRIEDLPLPLATVAADIESQREIVLRRGLVWQAVLASIAIPGIYPAVRVGPYTLVDGGVVNPVPCTVASDLGADVVIGVRLGPPVVPPDPDVEAVAARGRPPGAVTVIMRSIELMQSRVAPETADGTTFIIRPELPDLGSGKLRGFAAGAAYIDHGAAAARDALPRLAAALPWLRR